MRGLIHRYVVKMWLSGTALSRRLHNLGQIGVGKKVVMQREGDGSIRKAGRSVDCHSALNELTHLPVPPA